MKRIKLITVLIANVIIVALSQAGCVNPEVAAVMNLDPEITLTTMSDEDVTLSVTPTITPTTTPTVTIAPTIIPTPTIVPTPVVQEVTLIAVGDDLIHKKVIESGRQEDGSFNYDHLFENLKSDFEEADIAIINQETILGTKEMGYSGYPRFNSPIQIGDAVRKAGFDVVLHSTNHVMDMGIEGINHTLSYWSDYPEISVIGIHDSKENDQVISVIERNGIRIAFLNYTYGTNGIPVPKENAYMVEKMDEKSIQKDIEQAKTMADFIIVFPHWGTEYVYKENKYQQQWAQFFANQGVDLVIGTHPHVLQPVDWISGTNGHSTLVYYSLGNYVSTMDYTDRMLGGMAKLTIRKDDTGIYFTEATLVPIVTHYERGKESNLSVFRLADYTPELAARHFILGNYRGRDFSCERLNELAKEIINVFLPENSLAVIDMD